ncbi:MAG: D-2-hydroxyacid dehydrogenase [Alphaproteobacteria bacterium]
MRVLVLMRSDRVDFDELARRHPEIDFAVTEDPVVFGKALPEAEVLITANNYFDKSVSARLKETRGKLRWIQLTTSGVDGALRAGGFPKGVIVTNGAGVSAPMVAEHAFALMLAVGHRVPDFIMDAQRRAWRRDLKAGMTALFQKTLCIVGLGAIGQEAAKRARAFGMTVIGVSRDYRADGLIDEVFPRARLHDAFAKADVVLLSTVASAETVDMINARSLAAMKRGAILVNIARGDLIDEDALAAACRDGWLAGAGLDVTKVEPLPDSSTLWGLPNIIVSPHLAGGGADNSRLILELLDENLRRYTKGEPLIRVVDWESIVIV